MRWSKVKKEMEDGLAAELRGRVKYHITSYSKDYSVQKTANRAWITVDKKEILNISTEDFYWLNGCYYSETTPVKFALATAESNVSERAENNLVERGEFSKYDFANCCFYFLQMNIEEALQHKSPLINMFAVADRRVGKRRLKHLYDSLDHPMVRYFIELRLEILSETNETAN